MRQGRQNSIPSTRPSKLIRKLLNTESKTKTRQGMGTQGKNDRSKKEYETILTDKKKTQMRKLSNIEKTRTKNKTLRNNT